MGRLGFKSEYWLWLLIYILVNVIAAYIMIDTNYLIGDVGFYSLYSVKVLVLSTIAIVAAYYLVLKTFFNFAFRLKVKQYLVFAETAKSNVILGVIILLLQLFFLFFNMSEGINIAGSGDVRTSSPWAFFWVFVPIDSIFLVYYGFNREDPLFKYNLIAYTVSNIIRGWSGVFLFIAFFEWCRAYRKNRISFSKLIIIGLIGLFSYPLILNLKWVMRAIGKDKALLSVMVDQYKSNLQNTPYDEMFSEGVSQLVGRLQQASVIVEMVQYRELIQQEFNRGEILPFWGDGFIQIGYRRLMGISSPPNLGVAVTIYLLPEVDRDIGTWNISSGYIGWFIVAPQYSLLYILYTAMICLISVFLLKQLNLKAESVDMLWLLWLVYLMAGWLGPFISFVYAILLFIVFKRISDSLSRIVLKPKVEDVSDDT